MIDAPYCEYCGVYMQSFFDEDFDEWIWECPDCGKMLVGGEA